MQQRGGDNWRNGPEVDVAAVDRAIFDACVALSICFFFLFAAAVSLNFVYIFDLFSAAAARCFIIPLCLAYFFCRFFLS